MALDNSINLELLATMIDPKQDEPHVKSE